MTSYRSADGLRLAYSDEGAGLPLLCLPGLTRTARDFDYVAPYLSGVRLIRPDYRGRGRSEWADPATYTIPVEAGDVLRLMDHLGLEKAAILGTSRGGLIAMVLAASAKDRLLGVCLNDIGPELAPAGLEVIKGYIGRNPSQKTHAECAAARPALMTGFEGVPASRWLEEVRIHFTETPEGLRITYDPMLREAVLAAAAEPPLDLWPLFDALAGLPLAVIRGANSDLLTPATLAKMRERRPDMIVAEVPGRAHIPFLDEPESLRALNTFLGRLK